MPTKADQPFEQGKQYALKLLKLRPRSKEELGERLRKRKFSLECVRKILAHLTALGLVDDHAFAQNWTRWRLNNGYGHYRILAELKQKRVPESIIASTLENALSEYDEEAIAQALACKRMKRYKNLDTTIIQRRIYGFLIRKGFSQNIILKIIHHYDDQ